MRERQLDSPSAQSYEQAFVAESHFMWAFSHSAFVFGAAAKVGLMKLTARPIIARQNA